jgi:hypothetical protein
MMKALLAGLAAAALIPAVGAAQGYAAPPPGAPPGAYDENNYGPPPGAEVDPGDNLGAWRNRHDTRAREEWMEQRIHARMADSSLNEAQARTDLARLHEVRAMDEGFRNAAGGELSPDQRREINTRLERLADTILAQEDAAPGPAQ